MHTVGGVVTPAEVMMVIVPEGDELQIDAHLPPDQIDQIHKGQNAQVRFPAFNQRTTPQIAGVVSHVSADISRDPQQQSGPGYYTLRISLPGQEFARLGDRQLIAGMPAEVSGCLAHVPAGPAARRMAGDGRPPALSVDARLVDVGWRLDGTMFRHELDRARRAASITAGATGLRQYGHHLDSEADRWR
jgi:hypothetical protein